MQKGCEPHFPEPNPLCAAIEAEAKDRSEVKIYTDGSGFQKKIGAAAVMLRV